MKEDDRDMLIVLGIMGAIVLAGGVGMAVFVAHKNPGFVSTAAGFVAGSLITGGAIFISLTRDE